MKYLIPLIIIIFLVRYLLKNKKSKSIPTSKAQPEVLKQDPVCGVYVAQQRELSLNTEDGIKYFCSKVCMEKFRELKR
jgi:YHS domain-containing protein